MNSFKSDGRDRRRNRRVKVSYNILKHSEITALDLSESGMLLQTPKAHKTLNQIPLELQIDGQILLLKGEIMWCKGSASIFDSGYRMGVKFIELRVTDLLILRAYIDQQI